jgi:uncharacterized protein YdhG (YjbR/CyaY superfamily)
MAMAGSSFHNVFHNVDEYIAAQPAAAQLALNQVRRAIRNAMPQAEETISYNIPAYKIKGRAAACFAGWKRFYSIYPASKVLLAELSDELAEAEIVKSTIRFSFSSAVPAKLIGKIAKFHANEIAVL